MFDKVDGLPAVRVTASRVSSRSAQTTTRIRDAELLLGHATALGEALEQLRVAAAVTANHRRRSDLAADISTKVTSLFPRGSCDVDPATVTPADQASVERTSLGLSGSRRPRDEPTQVWPVPRASEVELIQRSFRA
jgi:hypothetical protein